MPSAWWNLGKEMDAYLHELEEAGRSPSTIGDYRWSLLNMFRGLKEREMTVNPRKVGRKEVDTIRNEHYRGLSDSYKAGQMKCLIQFCKWAGNAELGKQKFNFGNVDPTKIDWLKDEEAKVIRMSAAGLERMVVHCELDLGMRRIELLRLKVSDFSHGKMGMIHIHGKGRNGGKHRMIPFHPDTAAILNQYLSGHRADCIETAMRKNPNVRVPESLFIYERAGKLRAYRKTAMDSVLKDLSARIGIEMSNHDLRRTCGRMMYRAGVRIEQIARIFGHADTRTTMHYLGLDRDDMSEAFALYAQYQSRPIFPKVGIFDDSQLNGGRIGI